MNDDEFWIEPLATEGHIATVRASYNGFAVTISIERRDGLDISEADARTAYTAVLAHVPMQARFQQGIPSGWPSD